MAVLSAAKGNNSFKMAGANKEQKIDKHKPRYRFSRDVYKGSGFFPSPQVLFPTICLCSSHMLRAAAPCSLPQPQTPPQGFGTPTTAHQTSWIQHLNSTAWILRKLDQEAAGEAPPVLDSLSLPCFTAEMKHPCVMAQWFLAQRSMRCVSTHWNQ